MIDALQEPKRGTSWQWQWWVSALLLLATMLNYMDRQTLANLSVRIMNELELSKERYGEIEFAFGWAFAAGSLVFGLLADRLPVRWLYPAVVIGWSTVGVLTGLSHGFESMLACRILLGFFEAGHWPCALKTTQLVLSSEKRLLGNSVLQSGGAIGAILTPLVIRAIIGDDLTPGVWRTPFIVIGALGVLWAVGWLTSMPAVVPEHDDAPKHTRGPVSTSFWWDACLSNPRFWALVPMVIFINITWQLLRAWLPAFLQQGRGATEGEQLLFNSLYYVAADVGCIAAGAAGLWLAKRGFSVHGSRLLVIAVCALCTALTTFASYLPRGNELYLVLLVIAAGALGVFPCYYSLTQEVSRQHLGKVAGLLAAIGWIVSSPMQKWFGRLVDTTGSFDLGLALVGWGPALSLLGLLLIWPRDEKPEAAT